MKSSVIFGIGLNGAVAVALGAFGAHALKPRLIEAGMLSAWETAVLYQLVHAVACLGLLAWSATSPSRARTLRLPIVFWLLGSLLFSGSLYVLALGGPRLFGPITPLGGLLFIAGWALVAKQATRKETP
jgi:uncharacterized membrane protein YgdD (TMEM256/DUF423 family)